jgi:ubiquinone/menaquinone biosynthesis C-methylase UbiE
MRPSLVSLSRSTLRMVARYYAARVQEYDLTAGYRDPLAERARGDLKDLCRKAMNGRDALEVACGTGYWTEVVAQVANSVLATAISGAMLGFARQRLAALGNVRFQVADAYSLRGVPRGFTAAFAHWWWSHVPKRLIPRFLAALYRKLAPDARVLFVDQLPGAYGRVNPGIDAEGNTTEERTVSDGRTFRIVKNFPTRNEVLAALAPLATDVDYREFPDECSWSVCFRVPQ